MALCIPGVSAVLQYCNSLLYRTSRSIEGARCLLTRTGTSCRLRELLLGIIYLALAIHSIKNNAIVEDTNTGTVVLFRLSCSRAQRTDNTSSLLVKKVHSVHSTVLFQ